MGADPPPIFRRGLRSQRNAGIRLDHLLLTAALRDTLEAAGFDREVRGRNRASDHAPIWIRLSRP